MDTLYPFSQLPLFPEKPRTQITLTCEMCGNEFQREAASHKYRAKKRGIKHTYCSNACAKPGAKEWPTAIGEEYLQGATLTDLAAKYGFTPRGVQYHLHRIGIQTRKCGKDSHLKPYSKPTNVGQHLIGKKHTKATKQKMGDKAVLRMLNGTITMSSKLEDRVAQELSSRGYVFARQYGIQDPDTKRYFACADFLLIDGTVIEVNGTYWHTDPRKYPNGPINEGQARNIERYNRKVARLAELGIPVIELWEIDLRADLIGTLDKAL